MTNTSWSGARVSFPEPLRRRILDEQPICRMCGRAPSVEADHITPVAFGGTDDISNGQGLCSPCHAMKTRAEQREGYRRMIARRPRARMDWERHPGEL